MTTPQRCSHKSRHHYLVITDIPCAPDVQGTLRWKGKDAFSMLRRRCHGCEAWLPLGAAAFSHLVEIEIRATCLALDAADEARANQRSVLAPRMISALQQEGWVSALMDTNTVRSPGFIFEVDARLEGWLAYHIAHHDAVHGPTPAASPEAT